MIPFDGEADAIAMANDTIYGLSGSVWTGDGARARVARALETGGSDQLEHLGARLHPVRRLQAVGVGRELGPDALEHYTEVKNVYYATGEPG